MKILQQSFLEIDTTPKEPERMVRFFGHGANTKGAWGKGLALDLKQKYPESYQAYHDFCLSGNAFPGHFYMTDSENIFLVNLFIKREPFQDAKLAWVASSIALLVDSLQTVETRHIQLILPKIGCGLGNLKWSQVGQVLADIELSFKHFSIVICDPK